MARRTQAGKLTATKGTTAILLQDFPVELHRVMKAEAARRGVSVKALYAEACRGFLVGRK